MTYKKTKKPWIFSPFSFPVLGRPSSGHEDFKRPLHHHLKSIHSTPNHTLCREHTLLKHSPHVQVRFGSTPSSSCRHETAHGKAKSTPAPYLSNSDDRNLVSVQTEGYCFVFVTSFGNGVIHHGWVFAKCASKRSQLGRIWEN